MANITKNELISLNVQLSNEIAAHRAEISVLNVQIEAMKQAANAKGITVKDTPMPTPISKSKREAVYATVRDAQIAAKQLAKQFGDRFIFVVRGDATVIARSRAHVAAK